MLLDPLPEILTIRGNNYPINTYFRPWLKLMVRWTKSSPVQRVGLLYGVFDGNPPNNSQATMEEIEQAIAEFVIAGQPYTAKSDHISDDTEKIVNEYDFDVDGSYIYASFKQQYGIDLTCDNLHLYKFLSLFSCLNQETRMSQIMGWRGADLKKIECKEERARIGKLQAMYALPDDEGRKETQEYERRLKNEEIRKRLGF